MPAGVLMTAFGTFSLFMQLRDDTLAKLGCTTEGILMNVALVLFPEAGWLTCPLPLSFPAEGDRGTANEDIFVLSSEEAK
jgi:hypothetical protein